jgi:hypothetical protein
MEADNVKLLQRVNAELAANHWQPNAQAETWFQLYQMIAADLEASPEFGCEKRAASSAPDLGFDESSYSSVGEPGSKTPFTISVSPTAKESGTARSEASGHSEL